MNKLRCLIVFSFLFCSLHVFGQDEDPASGVGLRVNAANYLWPVTNQFNTDEFKYALELEYVGRLTGPLRLALPLKLGNALFPTDDLGNAEDGGRISLDVLLQVQIVDTDRFFSPYIFAGGGGVLERTEDLNFEIPAGLGFNFRLATNVYFNLKGEYRLGIAERRDNLQFGAGLYFLLGQGDELPAEDTDTDGDGLPDTEDLCPQEAGPPELNGCPDRDKDGVPDGNDACPDQPGIPSLNGCPDRDGDGVPDQKDNCPEEAGPPSNQGCPLSEIDSDGDGVPNDRDECPGQPGSPDLNGCPDRDNDGVPDIRDRCPDAPGPFRVDGCPDSDEDGLIDSEDRCPESAGPVTNQGCPELTQEEQDVLTFASRAVQFETGSARLTNDSYDVLAQIYRLLLRYPDYNLRISGHTDSVGSRASNRILSEERAKACYDYFVSQGIPESRMGYIGYGESVPIADNRYESGRRQNRRVVFELYLGN